MHDSPIKEVQADVVCSSYAEMKLKSLTIPCAKAFGSQWKARREAADLHMAEYIKAGAPRQSPAASPVTSSSLTLSSSCRHQVSVDHTIMGEPSRASFSSRASNFSTSVTACNPNSNQVTPKIPERPVSSSASTSSRGMDNGVEDKEYPRDPVEGWPSLAHLMAETPDFAAFGRFRDLNIKSLLYYQAQLTALREDIHKQEYDDRRRGDELEEGGFAERADWLMNEKDSKQFKLIKEMRGVLKEYNEALIQYSQVSALPEPETYNMLNLKKWLRNENFGNFKVCGEGENTWGNVRQDPDADALPLWEQFKLLLRTLIWPEPPKGEELDLVTAGPQTKVDGLTKWTVWYLIPFIVEWRKPRDQRTKHELKKNDQSDVERNVNATNVATTPKATPPKPTLSNEHKSLESWSQNGALRFTSAVSTVVACLLPVVAITALSQLKETRDLLLCIAGFSVIFAVGLIFLTNGTSKRVEIFTATAAFAAVMVVFISAPVVVFTPGPLSPSSSPSQTPSPRP